MLRKKGKNSITRSALYSVGLHLSLLLFTMISMIMPKKESNLLVDVEIAGEGEFREEMENVRRSTSPADIIPPITEEEQKEEPKAVEEKNIPEMTEEPQTSQEMASQEPQEKTEEPVPDSEEKIEEKTNEEPVPKENIKEEKKPKEEKKEKTAKKPKKRNKKALMDVIKKAEKAKKKKDRRKKLRDLAAREAKRKNDSDFEKMLDENSSGGKPNGSGRGQKGTGAGAFGIGNGISESDYEMVSSQIYPHWVVPSGVRDAENIIIEIHIELGDNGEVIPSSIKIVDEKRYATDHVFRAAADSARRAILQASPLSIPREKMNLFKEITLRFNLKEALGE